MRCKRLSLRFVLMLCPVVFSAESSKTSAVRKYLWLALGFWLLVFQATVSLQAQSGTTAISAPQGLTVTELPLSGIGSVLNVKDFGASGDGTANDTPAIQKAIDTALETGKTVYIPPAPQYYRMESALHVQFSSPGTSLNIFGDGLKSYLFFVGDDSDGISVNSRVALGKTVLSFRDFAIGGDGHSRDGLVLVDTHRGTFSNFWITGFGRYGVRYQGCYLNTWIGGGVSLNVGSPGNVLQAYPQGGIRLEGREDGSSTGSNGNTFIGVSVEGIISGEGVGIYVGGTSYGNQFTGGTSENNKVGVLIDTSAITTVFQNMDISVNSQADFIDHGSLTSYQNSVGGGNTQIGGRLFVNSSDVSYFGPENNLQIGIVLKAPDGAAIFAKNDDPNGNSSADLKLKAQGSAGVVRIYANGTAEGSQGLNIASFYQANGAGHATIHGNLTADNIYSQNGVIQVSDARSKEDIRESQLGLEFVNQLRPVSYHWKSDSDKTTHYGFIAQELDSTLNGRSFGGLNRDSGAGRFGINYSELISPIVKAIQEIYEKVAHQGSLIENLQAENAMLKARLSRLENKLNQENSPQRLVPH